MFPFRTALNASTLLPYRLDIREQIRVAAEAGYEGIEIWMSDLQAYIGKGGSAAELKGFAADAGIAFADAISFIPWGDADGAVRERGAEQTKEELSLLAELGCPSFAAPPYGDVENVSLDELAERFAALTELSRSFGVAPILEFWGRAKKLSRVSEALYVAVQSGVPDAKLLLDPFHMYTGGSRLSDLAYLNGDRIGIVHANDYPAEPPQATIADADRLFPGDGIAPSAELAKLLVAAGYRGYLSLELFFSGDEGRSAADTAALGLAKMKSAYAV
jgi:sugar phosphate isomerase/epimerase